MIKLYGLRMSNYYSYTKALLLEKALDFEEVKVPPSQDEVFLQKSPMGKMPAIEVDGHYLSETLAISRYAETIKPEPALIPSDPITGAKVIELVCHLKLDIELVARRCLPAIIFNKTVSDETIESTQKDLARGMQAVARLYRCDPWALGADFTLADLYTFYTFGLARHTARKMFDTDLLADYPQIADLMARLAKRPSIARVEAEKAE